MSYTKLTALVWVRYPCLLKTKNYGVVAVITVCSSATLLGLLLLLLPLRLLLLLLLLLRRRRLRRRLLLLLLLRRRRRLLLHQLLVRVHALVVHARRLGRGGVVPRVDRGRPRVRVRRDPAAVRERARLRRDRRLRHDRGRVRERQGVVPRRRHESAGHGIIREVLLRRVLRVRGRVVRRPLPLLLPLSLPLPLLLLLLLLLLRGGIGGAEG